MDDINGKLFVAVIVLGAVFAGLLVAVPILVDRTTEKVIEELKSGRYSPGPYAPGFDPDVVDPNFFRQQSPPQQNSPSW